MTEFKDVKKPRNYKYWSDDEVKKILEWFNLPENEGKLARNKAQACREVAKELFDGDEYMAISVRSKLMSLEKNFREVEQLTKKLNDPISNQEKALIQDKINELYKFHNDCKQLFGKSESRIPSVQTSPSVIPSPIHNNTSQHPPPPLIYHASDQPKLPHLDKDRLRELSHSISLPSSPWPLPRLSIGSIEDNEIRKRRTSDCSESSGHSHCDSNVRIARYQARQASYAAKQAHYEAVKAECERSKMEYAIQLAKLELDKEALAVKRIELELELLKQKRDS
ncbi:hypothetical protein CU097_007834 [Rhizopus azygosporus]|uniref:Uncharacterized protein n=2 Tax=Rhizopus TaxID=4842 RepID=A0A367JE31_RHIAZ|nr:hypothetical protein BCV71DRAFT_222133 [Rhizopus microsporus]RCH87991.1 hypothetical protein CU097_007834 [Rhizopus azygosporus]